MKLRLINQLRILIHLLLLRPLVRLIFGVNLHGRENIPATGPFIMVANHNSHLDILLLFATLPPGRIGGTCVVAARDYFAPRRRLFAVIDYLFSPIWVDRGGDGGATVHKMGERLDAGQSVIIFPEGTRGAAGEIAPFRSGVGRLVASRPEIPVIPVYLLGPERAMPRQASLPLPLWNQVYIGPSQSFRGGKTDLARSLRESILSLARSETAGRHTRRPQRPRALVVAVLGIDGSGKSTLSGRLAVEISSAGSACLIGDSLEQFRGGEPCGTQPLMKEHLRRWVSKQAKRAGSLAFYKIPKLTELLLRDALLGEVRRWYGPEYIFMDGSPLLNMTAWSVLYREDCFNREFCELAMGILSGNEGGIAAGGEIYRQFPELTAMKRLGLTRLKIPDLVIFLDVEPAVAMSRILGRGERVQVHETEEKLAKLRRAYLLTITALTGRFKVPALRLEGDREIETIMAEAKKFIREKRGERDEHLHRGDRHHDIGFHQ
jgi:1-acyl-sn-glycerol-3-phosphate acyltransferase